MKLNVLAIILAIALFGGFFFFYYGKSPLGAPSSSVASSTDTSQTPADTSAPDQPAPSTAASYDECIAKGNQPLPDDPNKCLTPDGHLFIKGVVE